MTWARASHAVLASKKKIPLADMSDMHRVAARGGGCGCIGYLESPKSVEEKVPGIAAATHNQNVRE